MAISDTITSMYENVGNVYDVLELAGADLTNVDKNIQNLKPQWEERLLYFLANGTDVVWNNWLPKVTGTGETITLNNTIQAPMKIVYGGNTSQKTTTGKNLLSLTNLTPSTKSGITLTKNNDGTITLNGTASADANFGFAIDSITATSDYKVQLYKKGGSYTNNYVSIYMATDSSFSNFDLLSLTNTDTISRSLENKTYTYAQVKVNGGVVCNNLKIGVQVVNGTTNTFEPYTNGASPNPDYPQEVEVVTGNNSITIANSDNTQSQTYPINLGNIELCKIGDYQDKIYKDNGKWYLNKQIGKVVLDGSENWSARAFPDNSYLSIEKTLQVGANGGYCDKFISNNNYDIVEEHMTISKQWKELCFAILKSRLSTQNTAGFKTWLSTHNTTCYYVLATPTYTKITDTTLISQLEAIKKSYNTQTNISQTNDDKPFILDVVALGELEI